jgi:hypothetical protein
VEQAEANWRRERLERHTTEDLLAALDPLTPTDQRKVYAGGGGKTLIRQILAERGVSGL